MPAADISTAQKTARYILIGLLVLLGGWMLRHFLPALAWAIVLGIATSNAYERWRARFHGKHRDVWAALTFTCVIGVLLIVPLIYGGFLAVREAIALVHSFTDPTRSGPLELPEWVRQLPWVGSWLQSVLSEQLADADAAAKAVAHAQPTVFEWTRVLGIQVFRRLVTLVFTLVTLYFVYLNRDALSAEVPRVSRRLFGPAVERLLRRAVEAIRATVDGIVLVALAQGVIMGAVYLIAGAPHPFLFGTLTGIFAMIPFAAPVAFGAVALLLLGQGHVGAGVAVAIIGSVLLFIADHFVRPAIIGTGARLPFLWVLLGILGGIESFGLVGLFLGPALMAALVSLWRSWVAESEPGSNGPVGD
jgi:predicted PurR-regulated permease PerM